MENPFFIDTEVREVFIDVERYSEFVNWKGKLAKQYVKLDLGVFFLVLEKEAERELKQASQSLSFLPVM